MKLPQLVSEAVPLYKSGLSLHLESPPGMGKTSVVRGEFIDALSEHYGEEFGFVEEMLATRDAPELVGYMVPQKDANGRAISARTFPDLMVAIEATGCDRGILFLDERQQADDLTLKAISPTVYDKTIGGHKLPPGWRVISASNRVQDGAGANRKFTHLTNREATLPIEFCVEALKRFGEKYGVHPMMLAYWSARPGQVCTAELPRDGKPFSTPRSQILAWDYIKQKVEDPQSMHLPADLLTQEIVAGLVGDAGAADMFAFFNVANELPSIDEIVADPMNARIPQGDRLDASYAAMQMCIHHSTNGDADTETVFKYITRLPRELQVSGAKSLLANADGAVFNSPTFNEWFTKNKALVLDTVR